MMRSENTTNRALIDDSIRAVRAGNAGAYEIVVRELERPLRAWLALRTPPGIDVDEVAQLAFVAAWTRLDDYEIDTNFAAWLFTIARFQLQTEMTRLRRVADYHTRYAPDLLRSELERRDSEPPEQSEARLVYLQACLEQVGEHLRRFITWRYEEEIPLKEMAARCGRSETAIKKQLWKLRRKLQACIEARMAAEGEAS